MHMYMYMYTSAMSTENMDARAPAAVKKRPTTL